VYQCIEVPNAGFSYLRASPDIRCGSSEHIALRITSGVGVALFVVGAQPAAVLESLLTCSVAAGLPVMFALRLIAERHDLDRSSIRETLGFLWSSVRLSLCC